MGNAGLGPGWWWVMGGGTHHSLAGVLAGVLAWGYMLRNLPTVVVDRLSTFPRRVIFSLASNVWVPPTSTILFPDGMQQEKASCSPATPPERAGQKVCVSVCLCVCVSVCLRAATTLESSSRSTLDESAVGIASLFLCYVRA